jgi:dolichol-phosphate mannosyltransferase
MAEQPSTAVEPVLVVIPTYNERENLGSITQRLREALPNAHVLVVDDGSLGAAYVAGFDWALERDYAVIVEMDADGSHAPEDLPRMLAALEDADLVIGSRYVPGGHTVNWPASRKLISWGGNFYSRMALGAKVKDITAGFRAYRRQVLEKINISNVASAGYCFQIDLAWRTIEAGFTVVEVPITFTERQVGDSKMSGSIVREALLRVTKWGLRRRGTQLRSLVRR